MKQHCEGFTGLWRVCPSAGPGLPPGEAFYPDQQVALALIAAVLIIILFAVIGMFAVATITDN